jgi:CRISPR/Cas system-associated exonuclease Cas4 (RecB family)
MIFSALLSQNTPQSVPTEIALLLLVLGLLIFMWDLFDRRGKKLSGQSGLAHTVPLISIKGSSRLPEREFYSKKHALISEPDALIKEKGYIIPVDVKPLSKKVRDRHVIKMTLHMKLIEELEGKKPPYGIILLGKDQERVEIENSAEKHLWLDSLIGEMRSILDGIPAAPAPGRAKCAHCDVAEHCNHKV